MALISPNFQKKNIKEPNSVRIVYNTLYKDTNSEFAYSAVSIGTDHKYC